MLAKRIITAYSMIERQLSKADHYAYGLRALKAVTMRCGEINRRPGNTLSEEVVVLRSLQDMNASKLVAADVPLFNSLLQDVFPNIELPALDYSQLRAELERQLVNEQLQLHSGLIDKMIQLYESASIRHGNMMVGQSLTGKTTCWRILSQALTALSQRPHVAGTQRFEAVEIHVLNPKSVSSELLYGHFGREGEWCDGVLSSMMRKCCTAETRHSKWLMLDGPVDTLWIESMNTVLDDNKVLTLINGDRIVMPHQVTMMFEVEDLACASPATVSRCGMVYTDQTSLTWRAYTASWLQRKLSMSQAQLASKDAKAAAGGGSGGAPVTAAAAAAMMPSSSQTQLSLSTVANSILPLTQHTLHNSTNMNKDACTLLGALFDKYVVPVLAYKSQHCNEPIPISDFNAVQSLCHLFDALATPENGVDPTVDEPNYARLIEMYFTFALIWSVGAAVDAAGRLKLDALIRDIEAQFPPLQTCYEYMVDASKKDWTLFEDRVNQQWRPPAAVPFHSLLVPTTDTVRYTYLLQALMRAQRHTLLCGGTGVGKSCLIESLLASSSQSGGGGGAAGGIGSTTSGAGTDSQQTATLTINCSSTTSSEDMQELIESRLEKRQRNNFGPLGNKARLITFLDDLNLPRKSEYGSVGCIELLRQWIDWGFVHDRTKQTVKHISDMQLLGSMGLPGGARTDLSRRFQSRFNVLSFASPNDAQIKRIYRTLIVNHLSSFDEAIKPLGLVLTQATLELYKQVSSEFLPTPSCSHYLFNMRDMSRVVAGLLQSDSKLFDTKESMIRLWLHECMRVFGDRLVDEQDRDKLSDMMSGKLHALFETNWKKLFRDGRQVPVFADFLDEEQNHSLLPNHAAATTSAGGASAGTSGSAVASAKSSQPTSPISPTADDETEERSYYAEVTNKFSAVKQFLDDKIASYNADASHVQSQLVLFDYAIEHVTRIYRCIKMARGSALLIGVGGSGRQSLTRLASYVAGYQLRSIVVSKKYRVADWREDVKSLYKLCGLKQENTVLLLTDSQLCHEQMWSDVNNILSSGDIPKLFPSDELLPLLEELRPAAQKAGIAPTLDSLYAMLIQRVRQHLHIVLCLSPVGDEFRNRIRAFPALVNNTQADWFNKWPNAALYDVSQRYLQDADVGAAQLLALAPVSGPSSTLPTNAPLSQAPIPSHGGHGNSHSHAAAAAQSTSVAQTSAKIKDALSSVFASIHESSIEVSIQMQVELGRYNHITPTKYLDLVRGYRLLLAQKRTTIAASADKLRNGLDKLESSGHQVIKMSAALEDKKVIVAQKKITCDKLLVEIVQKQRAADEQKKAVELDALRTEGEASECENIKHEAQDELDKVLPALDKAVKALEKLSKSAVTEVKSYQKPPKPVERVMCAVMTILEKEPTWASAKKELNDPNFLQKLRDFDKDAISNLTLKLIGKYTKNKDFNAEDIGNVSQAAGALCEWVCAMELYAKVFRDVEPRRIALKKAEVSLKKKKEELGTAEEALKQVIGKVTLLEEQFRISELEANTLRKEAQQLEAKLAVAAQLVEGLSGEKQRWDQSIKSYTLDLKNLIGDCCIAAAFLSYAGPFPSTYREQLMTRHWMPCLKRTTNLPFSTNFDLISFLATRTDVLDWNIDGLPSDSFSVENGCIVTCNLRHALMCDPQGQANIWIKNKCSKQSQQQHGNSSQLNSSSTGLGGPGGVSSLPLRVVDMQQKNYLQVLEQCIVSGASLLIQDVQEELDPSLDPVLRVNQLDGCAKSTILLQDKELLYNSQFRLYMTSKLANPHYKPELAIKVNCVNFAVVDAGLQQQLLAIVVRMEEPRLEQEKTQLTLTLAQNKRRLIELENQILSLLHASGESSILDDEDLIHALQQSRLTSEDVKVKLVEAVETEQKIDLAREAYRSCAVRASICFFTMNEMSRIDPMYQFSLAAYIDLFKHSITNSKQDAQQQLAGGGGLNSSTIGSSRYDSKMLMNDPFTSSLSSGGGNNAQPLELADRCVQLNEYHTDAVYRYVCRALFECHKLVFAFSLCIEKMKQEQLIDLQEYEFFLKGGSVLDRSARAPNPAADWLPEAAWDHITELDKLPAFRNIAHSFTHNAHDWLAWFKSEQVPPERLPLPGDWAQQAQQHMAHQLHQSGLTQQSASANAAAASGGATGGGTSLAQQHAQQAALAAQQQQHRHNPLFQQLLVLRCLRPDRVLFGARHFISLNLGPQYIESPAFDLQDSYRQSSPATPLVFVLSPGVDPQPMLTALALQHGRKLDVLALGQGQGRIALELIHAGLQSGAWVYLANVHLSVQWLSELDALLERIKLMPSKDLNPHFRLWLSSDPTPHFPISLLQASIKMTSEPPKGLRANMLRLYNNLSDEQWSQRTRIRPTLYKKALFALCWFHSVVVERKKFLQLGFNIPYAFNDSDWSTCEQLLNLYVNESQTGAGGGNDHLASAPASPTNAQSSIMSHSNAAAASAVSETDAQAIEWEAIRYLIGQCNYGGRVTDNVDRRLLDTYTCQFFTSDALSVPRFALSSLETYYIPDDMPTLDAYRKHIALHWPKADQDPSEAFGQHANADVKSQISDTQTLLATVLSLQAKTQVASASSSSASNANASSTSADATSVIPSSGPTSPSANVPHVKSRQDTVLELIITLLDQIPPAFEPKVIQKASELDVTPLTIVLVQELQRYTLLLSVVNRSLLELQKGIKGLIVISDEAELILDALYTGRVPTSWKFAYPSALPLGAWTRDLSLRLQQLIKWSLHEMPRVFWLAGFTSPIGFLTATMQQSARRNQVSIQSLTWDFTVTSSSAAAAGANANQGGASASPQSDASMGDSILVRPKDGAYIRGLYLEGARWDHETSSLADARPMELYSAMPVVHFRPVEQRKKTTKGTHSVPLYQWGVRAGDSQHTSYIMEVELKMGQRDASFWTKRGVALLMQLADT